MKDKKDSSRDDKRKGSYSSKKDGGSYERKSTGKSYTSGSRKSEDGFRGKKTEGGRGTASTSSYSERSEDIKSKFKRSSESSTKRSERSSSYRNTDDLKGKSRFKSGPDDNKREFRGDKSKRGYSASPERNDSRSERKPSFNSSRSGERPSGSFQPKREEGRSSYKERGGEERPARDTYKSDRTGSKSAYKGDRGSDRTKREGFKTERNERSSYKGSRGEGKSERDDFRAERREGKPKFNSEREERNTGGRNFRSEKSEEARSSYKERGQKSSERGEFRPERDKGRSSYKGARDEQKSERGDSRPNRSGERSEKRSYPEKRSFSGDDKRKPGRESYKNVDHSEKGKAFKSGEVRSRSSRYDDDKGDSEYKEERTPKTRTEKTFPDKNPEEIRLNRYIANAGICSRRDADLLIKAGEITVNGTVVTEMGFKVKPGDEIRHNNRKLKREKLVYILLNKPKDFITTTDDPDNRKTIMNLVESAGNERIYPVGRLDRNTTGLIILTNDGELADKLSHPSNNIKKLYQVDLDKPITQEDIIKIQEGVTLEDGVANIDEVAIVSSDNTSIGLQIHSGKNRIVRRIFEHLGYDVVKLDRVMYAGLDKKDLPRGNWRHLTDQEIVRLKYMK